MTDREGRYRVNIHGARSARSEVRQVAPKLIELSETVLYLWSR
jgi:hypothetical protein